MSRNRRRGYRGLVCTTVATLVAGAAYSGGRSGFAADPEDDTVNGAGAVYIFE
ncbi:MAG: hypothetical protein AAFQ65_12180 [Myxococcota bacterium]